MALLARFCTGQEDFLTASTRSVVSLYIDCGISSRYVQQSKKMSCALFGASTVICALVATSRWVLSCLAWLAWHTSLMSTFQARGLYELHAASRSSERLRRTTRITWTLWDWLEECQLALASAQLSRALSRFFSVDKALASVEVRLLYLLSNSPLCDRT